MQISVLEMQIYVFILEIKISVFQIQVSAFASRKHAYIIYLNSFTYICIFNRDICNNNILKISVFISRYICI